MKQIARITAATESTADAVVALRSRLRITWVGMMALVGAIATVGVVGAFLAGVSEDVISKNGLEVRDAANLHVITSHRTGAFVELAHVITNLGSIGLLIPLAMLAGVFLWLKGARLAVAAAPAISLVAAGLCAAIVKHFVARPRPPASLRLITETESSFPSGHSTDSAAFYTALALVVAIVLLRRPIVRILTIAFAGLGVCAIGASRLVLGVHWPTDVMAGWALGLIVAVLTTSVALLIVKQVPAEPPTSISDAQRIRLRLLALVALERNSMRRTMKLASR